LPTVFIKTRAVDKTHPTDWFQLHSKTHDSRLHKLTNLVAHEQVDETILKSVIRKAINTLLRKTG